MLLRSEQTLNIGDSAPDFSLKATDDKTYSREDFKGKPMLVVFMCNHCPYVKAKFDVLKGLTEKFMDVAVIGINPNDEVSHPDDSFEKMKETYEQEGFNFYYLRDETQDVAKAYGAVCTPDPFLFDKDHKLFFHGRLDDAMSPGDSADEETMALAMEKMRSGEKIEGFKPSQGCSIKWK